MRVGTACRWKMKNKIIRLIRCIRGDKDERLSPFFILCLCMQIERMKQTLDIIITAPGVYEHETQKNRLKLREMGEKK